MTRRLLRGALLLSAALTLSCENGGLQAPATSGPVSVGLAVAVAGGSPEAYDKANRIFVQFTANQAVRFEQELPFSPSGETRVPVRVPLESANESFVVSVELRRDADALFRASASAALSSDRAASVNLTLLPVAASLSCSGPVLQLSSYGASAQLTGAALFATGDTIRGAALVWSVASSNASVTVTPAGRVTAVRDGTTDVQCAAGTLSGTRQVEVFAVVRAITVTPAQASVQIGGTQAFSATLRDANGNVISRAPTWSSSNTAIATITAAGVASGLTPGNVRIDALSGGVTGSASLAVSNPVPTVTTGQASVVRVTAFIDGTVNPNGNQTQAYFEWGTSSTLAGAFTTTPRSVGDANVPIPVTETLSNLGSSTTYYYRVVASNGSGITRGLIQSFRTVDPGPPVAQTGGGFNAGYPIAQLDGTVIPMGANTAYYFQYGWSPDSMYYQTSTQSAGSGFDPINVTARIQWGSALYVQLIAYNQYGVTYGPVVRAVFPSPVVPMVQGRSGTPAKVKGNQRE